MTFLSFFLGYSFIYCAFHISEFHSPFYEVWFHLIYCFICYMLTFYLQAEVVYNTNINTYTYITVGIRNQMIQDSFQRGFGEEHQVLVHSHKWRKELLEQLMTCNCQNLGQCRSLFRHIFQVTYFFYEFQCRYEAGLLFAYLAFVPFCEAGVMDSLSLQVSYAAIRLCLW